MRCSKCGFENSEGMSFCGKCAAELRATADSATEVKCSKCGSTMPATATFCGICGYELSRSATVPPSNPPQTPVASPGDVHAGSSRPAGGSRGTVEELAEDAREGAEGPRESPRDSLREMVAVPGGWFAMGSPPGVGNDAEHPRHQVELSAYYIDRCTVSNVEYERFDPKHRRLRPDVADGDQDPVVFVSHKDCLNFCRWRAEQEGVPPDTYSLPTEAQWERAARGGCPERLYPWGDEINSANCNTLECGPRRAVPIDEGTPNDFGLFHMGSNVREWCLDYYSADYYASMDALGPNPVGPKRMMLVNMNVVRGASFQDRAAELGRCAARNYAHPNSSSSDIGFRCVRVKR